MNIILSGNCLDTLKTIPDCSVDCCVTSPPYYGLRDYGAAGQIGLEKTPEEYIEKLVQVFREVRRILRNDGTLWINIGDSYCSSATGTNKQQNSTLGGGKSTQIESFKRPNKKPHGDIKAKENRSQYDKYACHTYGKKNRTETTGRACSLRCKKDL